MVTSSSHSAAILNATGLLLFSLFLAHGSTANTESNAETATAETTPTAVSDERVETSSPLVGGWRIYLDPETGEIRQPSAVERAAVARRLQAGADGDAFSSTGLVTFPLSIGGVGVNLEGRFLVSTSIRIDDDGTLTLSCDHPESARPADAAPRVEER